MSSGQPQPLLPSTSSHRHLAAATWWSHRSASQALLSPRGYAWRQFYIRSAFYDHEKFLEMDKSNDSNWKALCASNHRVRPQPQRLDNAPLIRYDDRLDLYSFCAADGVAARHIAPALRRGVHAAKGLAGLRRGQNLQGTRAGAAGGHQTGRVARETPLLGQGRRLQPRCAISLSLVLSLPASLTDDHTHAPMQAAHRLGCAKGDTFRRTGTSRRWASLRATALSTPSRRSTSSRPPTSGSSPEYAPKTPSQSTLIWISARFEPFFFFTVFIS